MIKLEKEIGENIARDPTFTLPYWDWRDRTDCDICNNMYLGANVEIKEGDNLLSNE